MKTTLIIESESEDKLRLLIRIAEEMGIDVTTSKLVEEVTVVSENVLAEDWNSKDDERWDEVYAHLKK